jgi:glycerol-3-phosphate acyltransferase PlsY
VSGILIYAIFSYLTGCICFGYYLARIFSGKDLQEEGSRSLGATNAARVLGRWGFGATFILDFLKGYLVAAMALSMDFSISSVFLFSFLVVAGHIWPVQLGFRGGKGISTLVGTMVAIDYQVMLPVVVLFLLLYLIFRKHTMAGIFASLVVPLFFYYRDYPAASVLLNSLQIAIIFIAHRQNIHKFFTFIRQ